MGKTAKKLADVAFFGTAASSTTRDAVSNTLSFGKKPGVPNVGDPVNVDADSAAAGERERQLLARRRGRSSTILTGPLGDLNPAQLGRKVLTGA